MLARSVPFAAPLLIAAAVFAAGGQSLDHDYLNYDDPEVVIENPRLQDPGGEDVVAVFGEVRDQAYLPLYYLALMPEAGGGAEGHHRASLIWHVLTASLLFYFGFQLLRRSDVALLGALLFAVHPVIVESVAWISGRKDQVSLCLLLMGLIAWVKALEGGRRGWFVAAFIALTLAPFAKGTTVVHPALAFLIAWWLRGEGRLAKGSAVKAWWIALAMTALAATVIHIVVARAEGTMGAAAGHGAGTGLLFFLEALWRYVVHLVLPLQLSIGYAMDSSGGFQLAHGLGILILGALAFATLRFLRGGRGILIFGAAWILASLVPFNNVFPRTSIAMADRYLAVALPAFTLTLAWFVCRTPVPLRAGLSALLVLGLGVLHYHRTADFRDGETIGRATMKVEAESPLGPTLLAEALLAKASKDADPRALREEAIGLLRSALHLTERRGDPALTLQARLRLGDSLLRLERFAEAERELGIARKTVLGSSGRFEALGLDPLTVRNNYAQAIAGQGRLVEAESELNAILEIDPRHPYARFSRYSIELNQGLKSQAQLPEEFADKVQELVGTALDQLEVLALELETSRAGKGPFSKRAAEDLLEGVRRRVGMTLLDTPWRKGRILAITRLAERMITESPDSPHGYLLRSELKRMLGQSKELVLQDIMAALGKRPDDMGLLLLAASGLNEIGSNVVAARLVRKAMHIDPEAEAPKQQMVGILLQAAANHQNSGRSDRALAAALEAQTIDGDNVHVYIKLAELHEAARRLDDAGRAWRHAREIDPELPVAKLGEARYLQWQALALQANMARVLDGLEGEEREERAQQLRDEVQATFRKALELGGEAADLEIARRNVRENDRPDRKAANRLLRDRGLREMEAGEIETAIELLGKARDTDGGDITTRWLLAEAYRRNNEVAAAVKEIEVALALDPKDLRVLTSAARLFYVKGLNARSKKAALRFLELARDHPAQDLLRSEIGAMEDLLVRVSGGG